MKKMILTGIIGLFAAHAFAQSGPPNNRSSERFYTVVSKSGVSYFTDSDMQSIFAFRGDTMLWKSKVSTALYPGQKGSMVIRLIEIRGDHLSVVFGKHCSCEVKLSSGVVKYTGCD